MSDHRSFPGPRLPSLAQTMCWVARPIQFLSRCERKYGPVFRVNLAGWAEHVVIGEATIAKEIIGQANDGKFLTGQTNRLMAPVVSDRSVFLLDGGEHKAARRHLQQILKFDCLTAAMAAGNGIVEEILSAEPAELSGTELNKVIGVCSLAYILTLLMGRVTASEVREVHRELALVLGPVATYFAFVTPLHGRTGRFQPWRWAEGRLASLRAILEALARKAQPVESGVSPAVRHIFDHEAPFTSDDEKYHQLLSLLAAGFDTVTTAIGWATVWLSRDEDWTERLRRGRGDLFSPIGSENADRREDLLRWTCLEALRLCPVIEIVSRTPATSMILMGHKIENGVFLSPCSYLIHRDPKVYNDPLVFNPQRFRNGIPKQWEYFPFGFGERRCIGAQLGLMQMEAVLTKLLCDRQMQFLDRGNAKEVRRHVTIQPASLPKVRFCA